MSVPPESTLADPQQLKLIYNVELAECEAERERRRSGRPGPQRCCRSSIPRPGDLAPVSIMRLPAAGIATQDTLEARRARTPSVAAGESVAYGFTSYPHA
jgi:hypothetical protein